MRANFNITNGSRVLLLLFLFLSVFTTGCKEEDPPFMDISESVIEVNCDLVSKPIIITTNESWKATSSEVWCRPSVSQGSGSQNISIVVDKYEGLVSRTATVKFTTDGDDFATKTVIITQTCDENEL